MRLHSKEILNRIIKRCEEEGILTIADEVMTGFGRTGPLFVSSEMEATPDLICLAKGITGGFLPLGATIVKEALYESFLGSDLSTALSTAILTQPIPWPAPQLTPASISFYIRCTEARKRIERAHRSFQNMWKGHPKLLRCDLLGTILVLEYRIGESSYYNPLRDRLLAFFQGEGILLRPFGSVLYVMPPYCITDEELEKIYAAIAVTLEEWC